MDSQEELAILIQHYKYVKTYLLLNKINKSLWIDNKTWNEFRLFFLYA